MTLYIDENLPEVFAKGLNCFQKYYDQYIVVKSIIEDFGKGAQDKDFIPLCGETGSILITEDHRIRKNSAEYKLCVDNGLGLFILKYPKNGYTIWQRLTMLMKHWHDIVKYSNEKRKPFVCYVSPTAGIKLEPFKMPGKKH